MKTPNRSSIIAALVAVLTTSSSSRAEPDWNDPWLILFSTTSLPTIATYASSMNLGNPKLAIAQAALEDVAVYHDTGRLTGILPSVVAQLRQSQGWSEAQAINSIEDLATKALEEAALEAAVSSTGSGTADENTAACLRAARIAQLNSEQTQLLCSKPGPFVAECILKNAPSRKGWEIVDACSERP